MLLETGLGLLALTLLGATRNRQNRGGEGTRMKKDIYYRSKDGQADYRFSFEEQSDGSLRAYVTSMPSYGSRSASLHATHRLADWGRHYICWDRKIRDEEDLKAVAAAWSDKTQEYIKSGKRFS